MKRRGWMLFFIFTWVVILTGGRLAILSLGQSFQPTAGNHSQYTLTVDTPRGTIFDRNRRPITNGQRVFKTVVTPTEQMVTEIHQHLQGKEKETTLQQLSERKPFVLQTQSPILGQGASTFLCYRSSPIIQSATHLVGYVNSDGIGVSGLEKAYDFLLKATQSTTVTYTCDATGRALMGVSPQVTVANTHQQGVMTALDLSVQQAVESAFPTDKKGAVVVQQVGTGDILACYSAPTFCATQVEQAMNDPNSPLLNRALTAYNVGSLFKLCVAAAALEQGLCPTYTCTGSITRSHTFACHKAEGHGTLTMEQALAGSCNTYFIDLADRVGGKAIYNMAVAMGFGKSNLLCQELVGQTGRLPDLTELMRAPAELANFALGQGVFMATPLQLCAMVNSIANGGIYYEPRLILATVTSQGTQTNGRISTGRQVISPATAKILSEMMQAVMTDGTGQSGTTPVTTSAGKTATAQTGMVNSHGKPVTQAWFTGFFPADNPQYTVTILVEDATSGSVDAAPIFKEICDKIMDK